MALKQSTQAAGKAPVPSADGATDLIPIIGDYVLTGDEAANDIIEMAPLPAGSVPVDVIVDSADLATTPAATVGPLPAEYRTTTAARPYAAELPSATAHATPRNTQRQ